MTTKYIRFVKSVLSDVRRCFLERGWLVGKIQQDGCMFYFDMHRESTLRVSVSTRFEVGLGQLIEAAVDGVVICHQTGSSEPMPQFIGLFHERAVLEAEIRG